MIENELRQVIEEGEGYKIEFKESLANLDKELVAEAGLPPVEFEFGTFFTVIFQRKKAEAITEIFGAKFGVKFSENFSIKRKQLDRMVSIIIRGAQDRQVCAYRKRKKDDRGRGEMIQPTHSLIFPVGWMWSMFKVINQPFVLELNSNAGRMLLLSRTSLLKDI